MQQKSHLKAFVFQASLPNTITQRLEKCREIQLKGVQYVPEINKKLLSMLATQYRNQDSKALSTATACWLKINDQVDYDGTRNVSGFLFKAIIEPIVPNQIIEMNNIEKNDSLLQLYHERWGHQDKCHTKQKLEKEL